MGTMFENFGVRRSDDEFLIYVKDREVKHEERWVVASLSEDEGKQLYEYLKEFFE